VFFAWFGVEPKLSMKIFAFRLSHCSTFGCGIIEGYMASEVAKREARFEIGEQGLKLIEEMQLCVRERDVDRYAELIKYEVSSNDY
jgi:hypothetical protein